MAPRSGDSSQGSKSSNSGRARASSTVGSTPVTALYRGRAMLSLLRDLALGEWSYAELARQIGVTTADIADFAEENSSEISEVKLALAGQLAIETAGLWITKKQNRIAEIQGDFDEAGLYLNDLSAQGVRWSRNHKDILKFRLDALRQVADELGAMPQRSAAPTRQGSTVHYVIESDDSAAMT